MNNASTLAQKIHEQVQDLPDESLPDLAEYLEFLRFKARRAQAEAQPTHPPRLAELEGILKGYDFSPEFLAEARKDNVEDTRG